jgi:hypothetical protein
MKHGSVVMIHPDDNAKFFHAVPKDPSITELRLSLSFREVTKHTTKSVMLEGKRSVMAERKAAEMPEDKVAKPMPERKRKADDDEGEGAAAKRAK